MVFYKFIASTMIVSSCCVFEGSCYAGRNQAPDGFTEQQHLERKKSFSASLLFFQKAATEKPKNTAVPITSENIDFDDLSDLEEENEGNNSRFSLGAQSRLKNVQKRMKNGESPEEIQKNSKFWYERNSTRCTTARILQTQGQDKEAQQLINKAHAEGFPGATFELAQQELKEGRVHKAAFFLRQACKNIQSTAHLYDDQYLEILIAGIRTFVKAKTEFQEVFQDFKDDSLFQERKKEKSASTPSLLCPHNLERFSETNTLEDLEDDLMFNEFPSQKVFSPLNTLNTH